MLQSEYDVVVKKYRKNKREKSAKPSYLTENMAKNQFLLKSQTIFGGSRVFYVGRLSYTKHKYFSLPRLFSSTPSMHGTLSPLKLFDFLLTEQSLVQSDFFSSSLRLPSTREAAKTLTVFAL